MVSRLSIKSCHVGEYNCLFFIGLADENESVRDAALSAGHVFVEHYATTFVPKNPLSCLISALYLMSMIYI